MKKNEIELKRGMVVQLSHDCRNPIYSYCFMIILDPRPAGAWGRIQGIGKDEMPSEYAYYKASWEEMEFVGKASWVPEEDI